MIEAGGSLLVIEHNLDVIKTADWIIDLGPEGGDAGGHVVAIGTPEEIMATPRHTPDRYLKAASGEIKRTLKLDEFSLVKRTAGPPKLPEQYQILSFVYFVDRAFS